MQALTPMLHVPDVRQTAEWYTRLGASTVRTHADGDTMTWALVRIGGADLMFNAGGRPSTAHRREVDLYWTVADLDGCFARVSPFADLVEPIHETEYGMREFIIRDCNGFWITFGAVP